MGPPPGPLPGSGAPPMGPAGAIQSPQMQQMVQNMSMGAIPPEDQRMMLAKAMALRGGGGAPAPGAPPMQVLGGM